MGLDSVEIVVGWEETFGIELENTEAAALRTPSQAIDLICRKLGAADEPGFCAPMRAYHRFRSGIRSAISDPTKRISPSDSLHSLCIGKSKQFWSEFECATGIKGFRPPSILFRRATVRDAVEVIVARHLRWLLKPSEMWTRSLVRTGVRYGVIDVVGLRNFADDDEFVADIGIS